MLFKIFMGISFVGLLMAVFFSPINFRGEPICEGLGFLPSWKKTFIGLALFVIGAVIAGVLK